jgi:sugar phosphate isomerase/epimerase
MKDAWWGHGNGDIRFEDIIVALNDIGYQGPLSIELEDTRMDRVHGATESCRNVKGYDFIPSRIAFDAAF